MVTSLRLLLDGFSFLLVLTLLFGTAKDRENRLFTAMLVMTLTQLLLEGVMTAFNGVPGPGARALEATARLLFFLNHPTVPLLYAVYVVYQVKGPSRRRRSWQRWLILPAVVSGLMSLASLVWGVFFRWDGDTMVRGPWFWLFAVLTTLYMVFVVGYLLTHRQNVPVRRFLALVSFPLVPTAGGILEGFFPELPITWPLMTLALQLLFLTVQERKLTHDYLTECRNRRGLDEFLGARVRDARDRQRGFAAFLADVDNFKSINDRFGHAVGDQALMRTVKILQSCLRTEDFLARFGGDEFVGVLPAVGEEELRSILARIHQRFAAHRSGQGYELSLSIGADLFRAEVDLHADAFLKRLDGLMYLEKNTKNRVETRTPGPETA